MLSNSGGSVRNEFKSMNNDDSYRVVSVQQIG
jgi:hypothetical protein